MKKTVLKKADVGCILSLVTEDDLKVLKEAINMIGKAPNQVTDIYKLRRGRYNNVRIWSYFDAGTCRREDLFITDAYMNSVNGFKVMTMGINFENYENLDKILFSLNNMEINSETGEVLEDKVEEKIENKVEEKIEEVENNNLDWSDLI